ncbi:MAG: outer membrane beta-barrel protein [Capsulimonadaceae bacterium]
MRNLITATAIVAATLTCAQIALADENVVYGPQKGSASFLLSGALSSSTASVSGNNITESELELVPSLGYYFNRNASFDITAALLTDKASSSSTSETLAFTDLDYDVIYHFFLGGDSKVIPFAGLGAVTYIVSEGESGSSTTTNSDTTVGVLAGLDDYFRPNEAINIEVSWFEPKEDGVQYTNFETTFGLKLLFNTNNQ